MPTVTYAIKKFSGGTLSSATVNFPADQDEVSPSKIYIPSSYFSITGSTVTVKVAPSVGYGEISDGSSITWASAVTSEVSPPYSTYTTVSQGHYVEVPQSPATRGGWNAGLYEYVVIWVDRSAVRNQHEVNYYRNSTPQDNTKLYSSPIDVEYGDTYTIESDPSRTGYTFDGWYDARESGTEITGSSVTITGNLNLFAYWTLLETSITFNKRDDGSGSGSYLEGGTLPSTNPNSFADAADLPINNLELNYYTGNGWNTNSGITHAALTAAWTFSISSTPIDLYGRFRPRRFELSLKQAVDSPTSTSKTIEYNDNFGEYWIFYIEYKIPIDYTPPNNVWPRWVSGAPGSIFSSTAPLSLDPIVIIDDDATFTIFPEWIPTKTNTFNYELNGGTGGSTPSISGKEYYGGGSAFVNLPDIPTNIPTKHRYNFLGYNQNGDTSISYKYINTSTRYHGLTIFTYIGLSTGSSYGQTLGWGQVFGHWEGGHGTDRNYNSDGTYNKKKYLKYNYFGDWFIFKSVRPIIVSYITFRQRSTFPERSPKDFEFYGWDSSDSKWDTLIVDNDVTYSTGNYTSKKIAYRFNDDGTEVNSPQKYQYFGFCVNKIETTMLNFNDLEIHGIMDLEIGSPTINYGDFTNRYHQPSIQLWTSTPTADTTTTLKAVWELISSSDLTFTIRYLYNNIEIETISRTTFGNADNMVTLTTAVFNVYGSTQIGWQIGDKTYDIGYVIDQDQFDDILQDYIINQNEIIDAHAVYELNEYYINYKKSTVSDFYNNHYIPDSQTYFYHEVIPSDSKNHPSLKLKDLYIEYKGFRSIGWTNIDGSAISIVNSQGIIKSDFFKKVDAQNKIIANELKESIDLFLIWEKIDYKIFKNSHNFETIYSPVYENKVYYPSIKRLNHIHKFTNSQDVSSFLTSDLVIPNVGIFEWLNIKERVELKEAYNFFYDSTHPINKGLRDLQETYKKSSLKELADVILLNHSSELPDVYNSGGDISPMPISNTNDYFYYMVDTVNDYTIELSKDSLCEILVVGGGGGGGGSGAGGGGGGGGGAVIHIPTVLLQQGEYTVSVGKGGNGGRYAGAYAISDIEAKKGDATIFQKKDDGTFLIRAEGGGPSSVRDAANPNGEPGGSGGGAAAAENDENKRVRRGGEIGSGSSIIGTSGKLYQNKGADTLNNDQTLTPNYTAAGGGGGAGKAAVNVETGKGNGGDGIQINIDGQNYYWGGGGGGSGGSRGLDGGKGGKGGGGGGSIYGPGAPGAGGSNGKNTGHSGSGNSGGNGGDNTGGGGGGSDYLNIDGGNGGSGIVILRIKEGYNFNHIFDDSETLLEKSIFGEHATSTPPFNDGKGLLQYLGGTVTVVQRIKEGDFDDGINQKDYYWYGYFKGFQTGNFTFSIHTNCKIYFHIGFETDLDDYLYLGADGTESTVSVDGNIHLITGVYYPLKIHLITHGAGNTLNLKYTYNSRTFSISEANSFYHARAYAFPGTTSMTIS